MYEWNTTQVTQNFCKSENVWNMYRKSLYDMFMHFHVSFYDTGFQWIKLAFFSLYEFTSGYFHRGSLIWVYRWLVSLLTSCMWQIAIGILASKDTRHQQNICNMNFSKMIKISSNKLSKNYQILLNYQFLLKIINFSWNFLNWPILFSIQLGKQHLNVYLRYHVSRGTYKTWSKSSKSEFLFK